MQRNFKIKECYPTRHGFKSTNIDSAIIAAKWLDLHNIFKNKKISRIDGTNKTIYKFKQQIMTKNFKLFTNDMKDNK